MAASPRSVRSVVIEAGQAMVARSRDAPRVAIPARAAPAPRRAGLRESYEAQFGMVDRNQR